MKILRRVFYYFCAAAFLNLVLLACVYLYITNVNGSGAYRFTNLPEVNADSPLIEELVIQDENGEIHTKKYVETLIVTSSGLTTGGYVEAEPTQESEKSDALVSSQENSGNTTGGEKDAIMSAPDNVAIVDNAVVGQPLPDSIAGSMAIDSYLEHNADILEFIDLLNAYRAENGVAPLTLDYTLCIVAAHRSVENAWLDWFAIATIDGCTRHIRPNGEVASTISDYYGLNSYYSENIGRYQRNVQQIFADWQKSPAHNALLLSSNNNKVGLGVAKDSKGSLYWTAVFTN